MSLEILGKSVVSFSYRKLAEDGSISTTRAQIKMDFISIRSDTYVEACTVSARPGLLVKPSVERQLNWIGSHVCMFTAVQETVKTRKVRLEVLKLTLSAPERILTTSSHCFSRRNDEGERNDARGCA